MMSLTTSSVQFGFFTRPAGRNTKVEFDGRIASRKIPQNDDFANGVVYGNKQLSGRSKFEMEILTCSYRFGTLKLGIARHAPRRQYLIPSIAETAEGHLVWLGDGIYANDKELLPCRAKKYSSIDLHDLKSGCRVGFDISSDGKLSFTVNGYNQGIAARNVYKEGFTVRPVVDLFGGCRVTITQALTKMGVNHVSLQDRCLEVIAECLESPSDISHLPLPKKLKEKLKLHVPPPRSPPPRQCLSEKKKKKIIKLFRRSDS